MPVMYADLFETSNPLDIAENIIMDRDWVFDRTDESELVTEVAGTWAQYRMWLTWQPMFNGLTLSCTVDTKIPKRAQPRVQQLVAMVNEKIWLGHFELPTQETGILFRYSLLLREGAATTGEHMQELFDIAIQEWDRFYPAMQAVIWGGKLPAEAIEMAMFDTIAEA